MLLIDIHSHVVHLPSSLLLLLPSPSHPLLLLPFPPPSSSSSLPGIILPAVPRVPLESPASSEMNEEEESPDADYDMDDYDSEEEKRKKKRRPPPKSNRSSSGGGATVRPSRSNDVANDRPFHCTGELVDSRDVSRMIRMVVTF